MLKRLMLVAVTLTSLSAFADSGDQMNFRFSPIGLIVGAVNVSLDFAVAPEWTIGPTGSYWHRSLSSDSAYFSEDYKVTSYGVGARANWFMNGVYTDGLYVGPSIIYASTNLTTNDGTGEVTGSASGLFAQGLVGYGWFWDSFNILLGGGATVGLGDTKITVVESNGRRSEVSTAISGLALEFSLGWTF